MKGQGQRQLGPWTGLGGSDGLHHAPGYDMNLMWILGFVRPVGSNERPSGRMGMLGTREAPSNSERVAIPEATVPQPHAGPRLNTRAVIRS